MANRQLGDLFLETVAEMIAGVKRLDTDKIINIFELGEIQRLLQKIHIYYDNEYDNILGKEILQYGKPTVSRIAYSWIKSIMHISVFDFDKNMICNAYGKEVSEILLYANEILCWRLVFNLYNFSFEFKNEEDSLISPVIEDHFLELKRLYCISLFNAKHRLYNITPDYIQMIFELIRQRHYNVTDPLLKKLLNREGIKITLEAYSTLGLPVGLMMLDIDHFKQVNDTQTHDGGDELLSNLADILYEVCLEHDGVSGRFGGEEFWAVFRNSSKDNLILIANKINEKLNVIERTEPYDDNCLPYMSASIGIGIWDKISKNDRAITDSLFNQLDKAVYYVKEHGRNNSHFVDLVY